MGEPFCSGRLSVAGRLVLGVLCISQGPADALDQLSGEMIAGQVVGGDALVEHHSGVEPVRRFGGDEDTGHGVSFLALMDGRWLAALVLKRDLVGCGPWLAWLRAGIAGALDTGRKSNPAAPTAGPTARLYSFTMTAGKDRGFGVLLDIDGVLYVGDEPIEGAHRALSELRELSADLRLLTNTTSRSRRTVREHLLGTGFDVSLEEVLTPRRWPSATAASAGTGR